MQLKKRCDNLWSLVILFYYSFSIPLLCFTEGRALFRIIISVVVLFLAVVLGYIGTPLLTIGLIFACIYIISGLVIFCVLIYLSTHVV